MRVEEHLERARENVLGLVSSAGAVVVLEIEAKLAERRGGRLDPDILTRARRSLVEDGLLDSTVETTRGGGQVRVFHLPNPTKAATRVAARKRVLHARYLSWASTRATGHTNLVSAALEELTRGALDAADHYQALGPGVPNLLKQKVRPGPLDLAATRTVLDLQTGDVTGPFVLPIECKNIRSWIYPRHWELHQLLSKAAGLQLAHPEHRFVPVLVCRRAHSWTMVMARQLGFYVVSTIRQYIRPRVVSADDDQRRFDEVRDELGYDLVVQTAPPSPLVAHFQKILPPLMERTAELWRLSAEFEPEFRALAERKLAEVERSRIIGEVAEAATAVHGDDLQWHRHR